MHSLCPSPKGISVPFSALFFPILASCLPLWWVTSHHHAFSAPAPTQALKKRLVVGNSKQGYFARWVQTGLADCPAVFLWIMYIYTNWYPNVKQLSWAINKCRAQVISVIIVTINPRQSPIRRHLDGQRVEKWTSKKSAPNHPTWSQSKTSLLSTLIIGSKLTFISSSGRWLPTI